MGHKAIWTPRSHSFSVLNHWKNTSTIYAIHNNHRYCIAYPPWNVIYTSGKCMFYSSPTAFWWGSMTSNKHSVDNACINNVFEYPTKHSYFDVKQLHWKKTDAQWRLGFTPCVCVINNVFEHPTFLFSAMFTTNAFPVLLPTTTSDSYFSSPVLLYTTIDGFLFLRFRWLLQSNRWLADSTVPSSFARLRIICSSP